MTKRAKSGTMDYFAVQKLLLEVLGLSLSPKQSLAYKLYSFVVLSLFMVTYFCCMVPEFFNPPDDFGEFTMNLWFELAFTVAFIKMVTILFNRPKLGKILNDLQAGMFLPRFERGGDVEEAWIKDCVDFTKKQTITCVVLGFVVCGFSVVASMVTKQENASPRPPFGPVTVVPNLFGYQVACLYQTVSYTVAAEIYMGINVLYGSILAHVCVQCRILQNSIKEITGNSSKAMTAETSYKGMKFESSQAPWKYLKNKLKEVVLYHMAIVKIAEEAEEVFHIAILCIFTGMSACLCCIMYHGSLFPLSDFALILDVVAFVCATVPLFTTSYWGNEVIFESQAVANACYEVDFVGTDLRFQEGLVLLILRSQKPITLTVGKFAVLSLVTMVGVCRASYSYFVVLRNVNLK